jgi:hypothetical protein
VNASSAKRAIVLLWPDRRISHGTVVGNTMGVYVDQKWKFVGSTINMTEDEIKLHASRPGVCAIAPATRYYTTILYIVRGVARVSILEYFYQLK